MYIPAYVEVYFFCLCLVFRVGESIFLGISMSSMSSVVTPLSTKTSRYIRNKLPNIEIRRHDYNVIVKVDEEELGLIGYPELKDAKFWSDSNRIYVDVPNGWVAQWKANGSNVRIITINNVMLAFTRGGYLLWWGAYKSLVKSRMYEGLVSASSNGRYLLFGELVGRYSPNGRCVGYWRRFFGEDIGFVLFDIYDVEKRLFLDVRSMMRVAEKYGIVVAPVESRISPRKTYRTLYNFMRLHNARAWEGFVFKNKERGTISEIAEATKKLKAEKIKMRSKINSVYPQDEKLEKIYVSLAKFMIEGFLDPPITKKDVNNDVWRLRVKILREIVENLVKDKQEYYRGWLYRQIEDLADRIILASTVKYVNEEIKYQVSRRLIESVSSLCN